MQESVITSLTNSRVKRLVLLQQKSAERLREGVFVVEGVRELERCSDAGLEITEVYYCPAILLQVPAVKCGAIYEVTQPVYEKIAYRGGTEGAVGIVKTRHLSLHDLQLGDSPLIVVLESVEKPGNLGAVLCSADAAGVDAVIVCDPLTD